jgi:hypothetical protein
MFEEKERKYSKHYRCKCNCKCASKNHKYNEKYYHDDHHRNKHHHDHHEHNHHEHDHHEHDHHEHDHHHNNNSIYDAKCLYRCVQPPSNVINNCNNYYNCGCECDYYGMIIFNSDRGSVRQV